MRQTPILPMSFVWFESGLNLTSTRWHEQIADPTAAADRPTV
jgi:hypothetical protein